MVKGRFHTTALRTVRSRRLRRVVHRPRDKPLDTEILLAHLRGEPDPVAAGRERLEELRDLLQKRLAVPRRRALASPNPPWEEKRSRSHSIPTV